MFNSDSYICTSCGKSNYEGGGWSEIVMDSPSELIEALCPDCCQQRFPQFYSDYENKEEPFGKKILNGFFRWKGKNHKG